MKYIGRAVRYLVKVVVLIAALCGLLYLTGYMKPQFWMLFYQWQGWAFVVALVGWSLVYARTGFVKYTVRMGMASHHSKIVEAMDSVGYRMSGEELGYMRFRAHNFWTRLTLVGDDLIVIRVASENSIEVEGARSVVAKVEFRLMRAANEEQD